MNCGDIKKKSIVEIFNEMDYEEKLENCKFSNFKDYNFNEENFNELNEVLKITKEPKSFDAAVDAAVKAQNKWRNASALKKANSLHKIWKDLREISKSLTKFKTEFSAIVDYFDFYSDLTIRTEEYKNWRANGVVLIVLSTSSPFFVLGATVSAVLATGCSLIVMTPENTQTVPLFLEEIISEVGLPEGLMNVVIEHDGNDIPVSKKISKVFFCGSYTSAQTLYARSLAKSFNFICPYNTTAFILESCDLDASVDKIVTETWGKNSFFAVANVVVLESIHKIFIEKLENRVEQFMTANLNNLKFKDKIIAEKINNIILAAYKDGATVHKCTKYEDIVEWSPTILVNYQNQDVVEDVPILKVLICRTAKEGVSLVNNCRYGLGTSIWTEISSQALEISSMVISPNIWVNCHGVYDAAEPLQPCGLSGDCVLGGSDGILEYISFRTDDPVEGNKGNEEKNDSIDKVKALQMAISAEQAFSIWKNVKNRRKYLKDIAHSLEDVKELSKISEMVSSYAHLGNIINFSERNTNQEFLVVRRKIPIGVILLIVNSTSIDIKQIASLITPVIVLGNAVIVVLKEESSSVKLLLKHFSNFLPKNLLSVTVGVKAGIHLTSDPNIQAVWLYEESSVSADFLQKIKTHSSRSLKHIWIIPKNLTFSQHLFQKECLKNKIVWLTKSDQFP